MKIAYELAGGTLTNEDLVRIFPEWTADKIFSKTGIASRCVAHDGETALDLAERAARKLFSTEGLNPSDIDFILLCTQSSEYRLPSSSCLLQNRLGVPTTSGALTFDHGCSAFH